MMNRYCCLAAVLSFLLCQPLLLSAASEEEGVQWTAAHNHYRSLHGVPPVRWSKTLAASAGAYAATCPTGHSGSEYGENLAWASYDMGIGSVVKMWYDEEASYDYDDPGYVPGLGHFTQLVWKSSTEIGCAHVSGCSTGNSLRANTWVCQYAPAGNFVSQFAENVLPPHPGK